MGFNVHSIFPSHLICCVMVLLLLKEPSSYKVPCFTYYLISMAMTMTAFSIKLPKVRRNIRRGAFQPRGYYYTTSSTLGRHRYTYNGHSSTTGLCTTRSVDEDVTLVLPNIERIFILSDLHTDHSRNMDWIIDRCTHPNGNTPGYKDALLIAGDISHDLNILRKTFDVLQSTLQCSIFFVPGNHEAWIDKNKNYTNSFEKLDEVAQLCQQMGVYTKHCLVGTNQKAPSWIVPIHSWYDGSLKLPGCEDLILDFPKWPWADFTRCKWPTEFIIDNLARNDTYWHRNFPLPSLVDVFLSKNKDATADIRRSKLLDQNSTCGLITFSHFLPNQQALPDWRDLTEGSFQRKWLDHPGPGLSAKFALVGGSQSIDEQIRSISSGTQHQHIHVLGHSHRPKDFTYKGLRYIHHPLGKPIEREMQMISPNVDFKCIWDTTTITGSVSSETIIRFWEEYGGGLSSLRRVFLNTQKSSSGSVSSNKELVTPEEKEQRKSQQLTSSTILRSEGNSNSSMSGVSGL